MGLASVFASFAGPPAAEPSLRVISFLEPASAYEVRETRAGAPIHFDLSKALVALDPDAPSGHLDGPTVQRATSRSLAAWNTLDESRVTLVLETDPKRLNAATVRVRFLRRWRDKAERLARTDVDSALASGVIRRATVEINEEHYRWTERDLEIILIHEIGHVLGLGHSRDPSAVMFPIDDLGRATPRQPSADDRAGLAAIYLSAPHRAVVRTTRPPEPTGKTDLTRCTLQRPDGNYVVGPCTEVPASFVGQRASP